MGLFNGRHKFRNIQYFGSDSSTVDDMTTAFAVLASELKNAGLELGEGQRRIGENYYPIAGGGSLSFMIVDNSSWTITIDSVLDRKQICEVLDKTEEELKRRNIPPMLPDAKFYFCRP